MQRKRRKKIKLQCFSPNLKVLRVFSAEMFVDNETFHLAAAKIFILTLIALEKRPL